MIVTLHTNVIVVTIRISIADLIGGGGNTDVCPGRQTPSRRLCTLYSYMAYILDASCRIINALNICCAILSNI